MTRCFIFSSILILALAMAAQTSLARDADRSRDELYFGTLHGHSSWSIDAFGLGNRTGPDDAYRFARGDEVKDTAGNPVKLKLPLDFFMLSDHSEMMGTAPMMTEKGSPVYDTPVAKLVRKGEGGKAFTMIADAIISGKPLDGFGDPKVVESVWSRYVEIAHKYNDPGRFTTFVGYEWTSLPGGANMHRNVIFRDDKVPDAPFSALDSDRPEDLWTAMEGWRKKGMTVFAMSHNANASLGKMFGFTDSNGDFMTKAWAERRNRNERLHEAGQVKGVSMAHPQFSPNDEFADFELWNYYLPWGAPVPALRANYVREAWKMGLGLKKVVGVNPFMMGVKGGSDSHGTINTFEEFNNRGNHSEMDDTPEKRFYAKAGQKLSVKGGNLFLNPGVLTGVWASRNERGPIFDALYRKETYATSGTRIQLRMFAGYGFDDDLVEKRDWVDRAYAKGVPMGGELVSKEEPIEIVVWAAKSPISGNLDRIQVIKLWTDDVVDHERIYDVALSDGRKPDPETGEVPPVGNTVDIPNASYTNDIGDAELSAVWTDPDYVPGQEAVYYVRVLEIPTPRWSTFDAKTLGVDPPDTVPATIQERAWSSPVWVTADAKQ